MSIEQTLPAQCNALSRHCSLEHDQIIVEPRTGENRRNSGSKMSEVSVPVQPGWVMWLHMQQSFFEQLLWPPRPSFPERVGWAANRYDLIVEQSTRHQVRPVSGAEAHEQIDAFVLHVRTAVDRQNAEFDLGIGRMQPPQSRHQPQACKCYCRGKRDPGGCAGPADSAHRRGNSI